MNENIDSHRMYRKLVKVLYPVKKQVRILCCLLLITLTLIVKMLNIGAKVNSFVSVPVFPLRFWFYILTYMAGNLFVFILGIKWARYLILHHQRYSRTFYTTLAMLPGFVMLCLSNLINRSSTFPKIAKKHLSYMYNESVANNEDWVVKKLMYVQSTFSCCGMTSAENYEFGPNESCCPYTPCNYENSFKIGCLFPFSHFVSDSVNLIVYLCGATIMSILVSFLYTAHIYSIYKKNQQEQENAH